MDILVIEEKIKEIISDALHIELNAVAAEVKLIDDLGVDSLDAIEIILTLQTEFCIEIPEEDARKIVDVSDVICYIQNRLDSR